MFYIQCDSVLYGDFKSEHEAKIWLVCQGWREDGGGRFVLYRFGSPKFFATVIGGTTLASLDDLMKKMRT